MNTKRHPDIKEALRYWIVLGFISFGGPAGQMSIMFNELVEKKRWISESRFLHALNFCMLLPGPEAIQLAIYIGWLLHGTWGGLLAGIFFILPSAIIFWILSYIYVLYGTVPVIASIFYGLKPAVMAIVFMASFRIGKRILKNKVLWTISALSFLSIFFLQIPFPLIIISAAAIGFAGGYFLKDKFYVLQDITLKSDQPQSVIHDDLETPSHARPSFKKNMKIILVSLTAWWTPVFSMGFWRGWDSVHFQEGLFFSKAAMVTFGGAYAVLTYVAQQSVEYYQWLEPGQMIDGLGLAEATPGPLIMVLQFVGFLGGWNYPDDLNPLASATLGALVTTWVTFVPCFLWIFLGAPYIEKLRGNERLITTLTAVTAAVVGVIFNLAVWFGLHVLFPDQDGFDFFALSISVVTFVGMCRFNWGIVPVIFGSGLVGVIYKWLFA
jgi:chromate transporter